MSKKDGGRTFVRITNQHIYDKLECIDKKVGQINGSIKLHKFWLGGLTTVFGIAFWFIMGRVG